MAALLREHGFGPSRMRVLEQLGGEREDCVDGTADTWAREPGDPLNIIAVECRSTPDVLRIGAVPGLPDEAYEHDGQLTKRHVRAATLGVLAPAPANSSGTSAAAPDRSPSNGCGPIRPAVR